MSLKLATEKSQVEVRISETIRKVIPNGWSGDAESSWTICFQFVSWDQQFPTCSLTQMAPILNCPNRLAHFGKILRSKAVECLVNKQTQFVVDALRNSQPVKSVSYQWTEFMDRTVQFEN